MNKTNLARFEVYIDVNLNYSMYVFLICFQCKSNGFVHISDTDFS